MAVSVVIPALQEAAVIEFAVRRALAQVPRPEVIVADGGSRDGTPELAARAGARVVSSPRGRGLQMNRGAKVATGGVLVFLHADCWLEPLALAAAERVLQDPTVAAVSFPQVIEGRSRLYRGIALAADLRARWLGAIYGDSGLAVRAETFRRIGGFPAVELFEDVGISRRLRACGLVRLVAPRIHVSARRWEAEGIVRATLRNWWITARFLAGADPAVLGRHYAERR